MHVSKDYLLREIAGETILIPCGAAAQHFNGLVTLNELGTFIWKTLAEDMTADALIARITDAYDVDAATARADADAFLGELRGIGALED